MSSRNNNVLGCTRRRSAFSLIELSICTLLVATLLLAAIRASAHSLLSQQYTANSLKAAWLADAIVNEIDQLNYMEPTASVSAIGRESGESGGARTAWDDVDDYAGLNESPPQNKDGTVIANMTGWRRTCAVDWVSVNDTRVSSPSETGIKKATVTVTFNNAPMAVRVMLRSRGS